MFIMITLLHSLMIAAKMGFEVTRHFPKSRDLFVSQFGGGLLSFILFWTLSFEPRALPSSFLYAFYSPL